MRKMSASRWSSELIIQSQVGLHIILADIFVGADGILVSHDLAKGGGFTNRLRSGRRATPGGLLTDLRWATLFTGIAQFVREFLIGGFASELLGQRHGSPAHLGDFVDEVGPAAGWSSIGWRGRV